MGHVGRFARHTFLYGLGTVVTPLSQLILLPVLTSHLGKHEYGQFALILVSLTLFSAVSSLGLGSAFFRVYGLDYSDVVERQRVVSTSLWIIIGSSVTWCLALVLMSRSAASWLFGTSALAWAISMVGVVGSLENMVILCLARLRALEQPISYAIVVAAKLAVSTGLTLAFLLLFDLRLKGVMVSLVAGSTIAILLTLPKMVLSSGVAFDRVIARQLLSFGLPLVPAALLYWVLQLSDRLLLGKLASVSDVGIYALGYNIGMVVSIGLVGPFTLAWPATMYAVAREDGAPHFFALVATLFAALGGLAIFGMTLIAYIGIPLIFDPAFEPAKKIVPWVALAATLYGLYYVFGVGLNLARKTRFLPLVMLAAAVVNVAANLVLIPAFGALGAALATVLGYLFLPIGTFWISQRYYSVPYRWGEIFAPLLAALAGSVALVTLPSPVSWAIWAGTFLVVGIKFALRFRGQIAVVRVNARHRLVEQWHRARHRMREGGA
jgi:O-antigen/teichoic acid export membrane protein